MGTVPFGYTNVNPGKGKEQQLIVNKKGEILKYAFKLKVEKDLTLAEIERLTKKKGHAISAKRLSDYFKTHFIVG